MKNEDFFYISVQIYVQGIYKWFFEEKFIKKASQVRFIPRSSIRFCRRGCYNVKYVKTFLQNVTTEMLQLLKQNVQPLKAKCYSF